MNTNSDSAVNPRFSIVIPCYNRPELLARALKSCIEQTFSDFEAIVVDDGSKEDLRSVVGSFEDPRFRYIRQENAGGSAARNTGIRSARADWIAFLDSDDLFLPEKLATFDKRIRENPADLLYSYAYIDRGAGSYWKKPERPPLPGEHITDYLFSAYQRTPTSTFVVRREVADSVRFDTSLPLGQDIVFKTRLAGTGHSIGMIEEILSIYDDSGSAGRISRSDNGHILEAWVERNRKYFSRKGYYGYRATILSKYIAHRKPFTAARDLAMGIVAGGVGLKMTLRRAVRAFAPNLYNKLVAAFMAMKGKSSKSA